MIKELEFLKIISDYPCVEGIGDDCAIIPINDNKVELISTDMLVEGNHFPMDFKDFKAVGEKAVTVNVSDILAGGGIAERLFISLALPADFSSNNLKNLYDGLNEACMYFNVLIAGGDITATTGPMVINVTITGTASMANVLTRRGALQGDDVYVSGPLGGARLSGYAVTEGYYKLLPVDDIRYIVDNKHANCLTDISDGLARSLYDIAARSNIGFAIEEGAVPVAPGAGIMDALNGGEDYQILFTASPSLRPVLENRFHLIGQVTESKQLLIKKINEIIVPITESGYDHFRAVN